MLERPELHGALRDTTATVAGHRNGREGWEGGACCWPGRLPAAQHHRLKSAKEIVRVATHSGHSQIILFKDPDRS